MMKELFELAYEKYPIEPCGFLYGELIDGNSEARMAFMEALENKEKIK